MTWEKVRRLEYIRRGIGPAGRAAPLKLPRNEGNINIVEISLIVNLLVWGPTCIFICHFPPWEIMPVLIMAAWRCVGVSPRGKGSQC